MPIMYKLTTQDCKTHGGMTWKIGKKNVATKNGTTMCTDQVLHCYSDPRLAIIFNSLHADIKNPRLFKIECSKIVASDKLKFACKEQTPVEEMGLPTISLTQKIAFAIKCALLVDKTPHFGIWADNWLSSRDRSRTAAASAAADAAAYAAYADDAAAYAAYAASAADAAYAASAAYAADAAAYAAAYAASAAYAAKNIDFVSIIDWVMENIS